MSSKPLLPRFLSQAKSNSEFQSLCGKWSAVARIADRRMPCIFRKSPSDVDYKKSEVSNDMSPSSAFLGTVNSYADS